MSGTASADAQQNAAPAAQPTAADIQQVMQVMTGYIGSAALYAATQLGIADHLAAGARDVGELAALCGVHEDGLYRVLRLLASLGIFTEPVARRFALSGAAQLLRRGAPGSLHGIAAFLPDPTHFRVYANLTASLAGQTPAAQMTLGAPVFEYFAQHPEYSETFNAAMSALSAPVAAAAIEAYDFGRFGLLVDVGGGHGALLLSILRAHPRSRGHVAEGARARISDAGLAARCEALACDFFESVPAGGDAYLLKLILHDWDDEHAVRILQGIARAAGERHVVLIVLESVIPEGSEPSQGKFIDLEMLTFTTGRERTATQFRALLARAGFELTRIVPTHSALAVIEAVRG
jgi:hypothetical protein